MGPRHFLVCRLSRGGGGTGERMLDGGVDLPKRAMLLPGEECDAEGVSGRYPAIAGRVDVNTSGQGM